MYMLGLGEKAATPETPFSGQVFLHGFDFFKEIDGKSAPPRPKPTSGWGARVRVCVRRLTRLLRARVCVCVCVPPCAAVHYMEDTHKANHHAAEEERICMELVRQLRVAFL